MTYQEWVKMAEDVLFAREIKEMLYDLMAKDDEMNEIPKQQVMLSWFHHPEVKEAINRVRKM